VPAALVAALLTCGRGLRRRGSSPRVFSPRPGACGGADLRRAYSARGRGRAAAPIFAARFQPATGDNSPHDGPRCRSTVRHWTACPPHAAQSSGVHQLIAFATPTIHPPARHALGDLVEYRLSCESAGGSGVVVPERPANGPAFAVAAFGKSAPFSDARRPRGRVAPARFRAGPHAPGPVWNAFRTRPTARKRRSGSPRTLTAQRWPRAAPDARGAGSIGAAAPQNPPPDPIARAAKFCPAARVRSSSWGPSCSSGTPEPRRPERAPGGLAGGRRLVPGVGANRAARRSPRSRPPGGSSPGRGAGRRRKRGLRVIWVYTTRLPPELSRLGSGHGARPTVAGAKFAGFSARAKPS
jgi:hypothetical protein